MATSKKILSPEILVPRIGEYLVQKQMISLSDLNKGLFIQLERTKQGEEIPLGKLLVELNLINQDSLDMVITEQLINFRDALEQSNRQLEQRVQQRTAELQDALNKINELNQLKNNFISNISHELRTPLTHIKGYLDLMISNDLGPLSDDQTQVLEIMNKATNRLERLIEDLIMFTFAEREQVMISPSKFDLVAMANEIILNFHNTIPQRTLILTVDSEINSLFVNADQKKIIWVINHLIENATKFSKKDAVVELSISSSDDLVCISVKDNGIGISANKLEEIFNPFHQLDSSSTRKAGGVGLGLALAKKIIEAHGSTLKVKSQLDVGSTFDFSLRKLIK
ncbi:MAG: ATP-binding protein [Anaerolineaceae bacterium]|nr:ATP-binding protein [Anaerolineaceae bacterium]